MTDEELIARLRDLGFNLTDAAADRIEALTDQGRTLRLVIDANIEKHRSRAETAEAKLAKAVEGLEQIAQPKVGPDFDWTEDETNKWRAVWYRKYQDIARASLAEIKGESHE